MPSVRGLIKERDVPLTGGDWSPEWFGELATDGRHIFCKERDKRHQRGLCLVEVVEQGVRF